MQYNFLFTEASRSALGTIILLFSGYHVKQCNGKGAGASNFSSYLLWKLRMRGAISPLPTMPS